MSTLKPITSLPKFSQIQYNNIQTELEHLLTNNREHVQKLIKAQTDFTWQKLIAPLEEIQDAVNNMWSPIRHLHAVMNSDELRKVYESCLPILSEYYNELSQNVDLYNAIQTIADSDDFTVLDQAQQKVISNYLRDFRLAGVNLPTDKKRQFADLNKKLTLLTNKFEQNVLDATQAWTCNITDETKLKGLPKYAIAAAKQAAQYYKVDGWVFTLEMPAYIAVMTYADDEKLRENMYNAYVTRASDQGPNANQWNNDSVIHDILTTRLQMAQLVNFNNYADYSLATKMADSGDEVLTFLQQLADAAHSQAQSEFDALKKFAKDEFDKPKLDPWDIAYYSEKLRQHRYAISQEELRPYFPETQVLQGLFDIVHKLYDINVAEIKEFDSWQKDVKLFAISDNNKNILGYFYIDLYARRDKRGGAWMDECRCRRLIDDASFQAPVTYLTCNFNAPTDKEPALFTHDEVQTLFHEFGHSLQHMLTTINYLEVSGINGVPWDAVELASQFMENWCWQSQGIELITKHFQTGETLPDDLLQKMHKAKNFQSALQTMRQLEFSLFDFRLHAEFDPKDKNQTQRILDEVRHEMSITPIASYNRFQNSFSHIFAGGYAAGYYSYKWAEVLACDAFSAFEENGIFDKTTATKFLTTFLEQGGSAEPMDLFIQFRGRKPTIDALLQQNGIQ